MFAIRQPESGAAFSNFNYADGDQAPADAVIYNPGDQALRPEGAAFLAALGGFSLRGIAEQVSERS